MHSSYSQDCLLSKMDLKAVICFTGQDGEWDWFEMTGYKNDMEDVTWIYKWNRLMS